jgi:hypothetical protein
VLTNSGPASITSSALASAIGQPLTCASARSWRRVLEGERLDDRSRQGPVTRHADPVAKLDRGGADQHALAGDRGGIEAAAQQIDEAQLRDRVRIDAVVDQDLRADVGVGGRGGIVLQPDRRSRQIQVLAGRAASDAAYPPVAIGPKVDRDGADLVAERRDRSGVDGLDPVVGGLAQVAEDWQDDALRASMRQGLGKHLVVPRL